VITLALLCSVQALSPDSLTLDAALALARHNRPAISSTSASMSEARASLRVAGTIPNPTVNYSRTQSAPGDHLLFDQPLDFLLTRAADRSAAEAGLVRARADSTFRNANIITEVRVAFYAKLAADRSYAAVAVQSALADSLGALAERRLKAGDISELERDQLLLEAGRTRAQLSTAREEATVAGFALQRVLGLDPARPLPVLAGELDSGLDAAESRAPADQLTLPELRAAVADSVAAAAEARSTRRARVPLPTVEAGLEWNDPTLPGRTLSVIGLALPLPFWNVNGGRVAQAEARASQASSAAAEARLESARRIAEAQTRLAESASRALQSRDSLAPAAQRLAHRAARAYEAGETGVLPVLDALRSERESTLQLLRDLLAFQTAQAEWLAIQESAR
jgi:cobalt-zinc-cadmium efflux system outer membrane protein